MNDATLGLLNPTRTISPPLRTFSFGGGVQSMAALVLAVRKEIDFRTFLFCNVGDDSEDPLTLDYFYEHAGPYAERNGIAMHELARRPSKGHFKDRVETLYGRLTREGSRSLPIPLRMNGNGAPGTRSCTADFKINVIAKWQRDHGASASNVATCGLGISLDEFARARSDSGFDYQRLEYPLIALRLTRQDCRNIIASAGLPIPPKSSCWFCPFHSLRYWVNMRDTRPELFARSCELEDLLNARRAALGKDSVWLTTKLAPLSQIFGDHRQLPMYMGDASDDAEDACESGYCMT